MLHLLRRTPERGRALSAQMYISVHLRPKRRLWPNCNIAMLQCNLLDAVFDIGFSIYDIGSRKPAAQVHIAIVLSK